MPWWKWESEGGRTTQKLTFGWISFVYQPDDPGHGPTLRSTSKAPGKTISEAPPTPLSVRKAERAIGEFRKYQQLSRTFVHVNEPSSPSDVPISTETSKAIGRTAAPPDFHFYVVHPSRAPERKYQPTIAFTFFANGPILSLSMCPKCRSSSLKIRRLVGFERIIALITEKRKYLCLACSHRFRAPDRRQHPRKVHPDNVPAGAVVAPSPRS